MFAKLIDRILEASWSRVQLKRQERDAVALSSRPIGLRDDGPPATSRIRQFTVHDAMNGTYIEFMKRKYNPHGADDYQREIYIVRDGESVIDAISTVLVLTEK